MAGRAAGGAGAGAGADRPPGSAVVDRLLGGCDVIVTCGAGGVGKTTVAAALAATAAVHEERRVLVLTIDPARRLASAMGLDALGDAEAAVPAAALAAAAAAPPKGALWAAMLDTRRSWDDLVARHAPDAATRDAILANPLYRNVTGRFVQSHDYIAMERLHELRTSGRYDLVVVDTPPTRHAIDFLEAPARMADFFRSRLLRVLVAPARSRVVGLASRPFTQVADRILGRRFLEDIARFFALLETMADGFVARAEAVTTVLREPATAFVVVATPEDRPLREARYFVDALRARDLRLGAVVLNRVRPEGLLDAAAAAVAEDLRRRADELADELAPVGGPGEEPVDPADVARVLGEVGASFLDHRAAARRDADRAAPLLAAGPSVAVPELDADVQDLAGLLRVGAALRAGSA